jgi:hypothetical protein
MFPVNVNYGPSGAHMLNPTRSSFDPSTSSGQAPAQNERDLLHRKDKDKARIYFFFSLMKRSKNHTRSVDYVMSGKKRKIDFSRLSK